MSWLQQLDQAHAELAERSADPWRKKLEGAVRGIEAISTAALLDLLRVPATTGTARRIAKIMRGLFYSNQNATAHAGWFPRHRNPRLGAPHSRNKIDPRDEANHRVRCQPRR